MIKSLTIAELKEYLSGNCTPQKHAAIADFIAKHPHYAAMLKGLEKIEQELPGMDGMDFLDDRHKRMKGRLFS